MQIEVAERVREVLDIPSEQVAERGTRVGELAVENRVLERRQVGMGARV
jgi:hypothetical protein